MFSEIYFEIAANRKCEPLFLVGGENLCCQFAFTMFLLEWFSSSAVGFDETCCRLGSKAVVSLMDWIVPDTGRVLSLQFIAIVIRPPSENTTTKHRWVHLADAESSQLWNKPLMEGSGWSTRCPAWEGRRSHSMTLSGATCCSVLILKREELCHSVGSTHSPLNGYNTDQWRLNRYVIDVMLMKPNQATGTSAHISNIFFISILSLIDLDQWQ